VSPALLEMKYSLPDAEMREYRAYGFANVMCLEFDFASAQDEDCVPSATPTARRPTLNGPLAQPPDSGGWR